MKRKFKPLTQSILHHDRKFLSFGYYLFILKLISSKNIISITCIDHLWFTEG